MEVDNMENLAVHFAATASLYRFFAAALSGPFMHRGHVSCADPFRDKGFNGQRRGRGGVQLGTAVPHRIGGGRARKRGRRG